MINVSRSRSLMLSGLLLCFTWTTAHAAMDFFLKVTDMAGESLDKEHLGQVDILAWGWGVSNSSGALAGGGTGAGKANFQNLSLTKYIDRSSTALMGALAKGTPIPRVILYVRSVGAKPVQFYKLVCEQVYIASIRLGGNISGDRATENISLNCGQVGVEYIRIDSAGVAKPPVRFAWNIAENIEGGVNFSDPVDTDGDGLPDAWESFFGTNPIVKDANQDLDGDGATNFEEYIAGTDPSRRDSVFTAKMGPPNAAGDTILSWTSVPAEAYRVLVSDRVDGQFLLLQTVPSAGNGVTSITVPTLPTHRFFRVEVGATP